VNAVEQAWYAYGNIMAISGVGFWCAFGLVYMLFTRGWWRSLVGVVLATVSTAFITIGIPIVLALVYGHDYPGKLIIRTIGFTLFGIASAMFFLTFLQKRRAPERPLDAPFSPSAGKRPAE
jgi:ABC-type sugar transport system permease subunit